MQTLHAVGVWLLLVTALGLTGCATNRINWAERVGNYTLDQATLELGPAEKQASLSDGTVVAEWMTRRGRVMAYTPGPGIYGYSYVPGYYYGGFAPTYIQSVPDYYTRLTFGPDGKLRDWKNITR
jgi:hypothetical protein